MKLRWWVVILFIGVTGVLIAISLTSDKVYHNGKYRFNFEYPARLQHEDNFTQTYFNGSVWSVAAETAKNNAEQDNVVELPIYTATFQDPGLGHAFYDLMFRVGVSVAANDVKNCYQLPNGGIAQQQFAINDMPFKKFHYVNAAMMKSLTADIYRTVYRDSCYSFEIITYQSGVTLPTDLQATVAKQQTIANKILASIRFH